MLRNAEATRAAIITALQDFRTDPRIEIGDPILIYYAGHGSATTPPTAWEAEDSMIQALVPYDCGTEIHDREVHAIPDRTVGALLSRLACDKGDNIVRSIVLSLGSFF